MANLKATIRINTETHIGKILIPKEKEVTVEVIRVSKIQKVRISFKGEGAEIKKYSVNNNFQEIWTMLKKHEYISYEIKSA